MAEENPTPETPETPQVPAVEPAKEEPTPKPVDPPLAPETPVPALDAEVLAKIAAAETARAEAEAKRVEAENALKRERIARTHDIPDDLMPMLRDGSLEADAKALSPFLRARGSLLGTGGLDPTETPHNPAAEGKALADKLLSRTNLFR